MKLFSLPGVSASLTFALISSLFGIQQAVIALPGQTFQRAQEMVRDSSLFQGMSLSEENPNYYTISRTFDGGEAVLFVTGDSDLVGAEMLQFRYTDSRVSFERESENSVALIEAVWGTEIAQDYINSRYTDEIPGNIGLNHYYLGEKYGYRRWNYNDPTTGKGIDSFTVMDLSAWDESRSNDRFCLTNPTAAECQGT